MSKILVLDPAANPFSDERMNVGDEIIQKHVYIGLREMFPGHEIINTPLHTGITKKTIRLAAESKYVFVGGSNAMSVKIRKEKRLSAETFYQFISPKISNIVLMGVGYNSFSTHTGLLTRYYYHKILNNKIRHSVRDNFSSENLKKAGFSNVEFTACPTTWNMPESARSLAFDHRREHLIFTLTNYNKNPKLDQSVIEAMLEYTKGRIYFFPQNTDDASYLKELDIYRKNTSKFKVLPASLIEYEDLLKNSAQFNYVGTRLHGGIEALNHNIPSLILSVDNRAFHMKESIDLPVAGRSDLKLIRKWLSGEIISKPISIPFNNIRAWKSQFMQA